MKLEFYSENSLLEDSFQIVTIKRI